MLREKPETHDQAELPILAGILGSWSAWRPFARGLASEVPMRPGIYVISLRTELGLAVPIYVGSGVVLLRELRQRLGLSKQPRVMTPLGHVLRNTPRSQQFVAWAECADHLSVEKELIQVMLPDIVNVTHRGAKGYKSAHEQARQIVRLHGTQDRVEIVCGCITLPGPKGSLFEYHPHLLDGRNPRQFGFRVDPLTAQSWFDVRSDRVAVIAEVIRGQEADVQVVPPSSFFLMRSE